MPNQLIHESSPYLLQHANNPVNWFAWNEAALQKAADEKKLVIISIGYSACHWCHVMEHESFENDEVALIMNEHFVSIKVDREERPDIDAVYMQAVQMMTGQGGWPLNIIALPNGKPIYGGTYFRKHQWMELLQQLAEFYRRDEKKCLEYAEELAQGVNRMQQFVKTDSEEKFTMDDLKLAVENWQRGFDFAEGGPNRSPKFPMPNNYLFLLQYAHLTQDKNILDYVLLTLKKMAYGGIYDQLGGGFARYSTDSLWKAPHFEKMLYDNAQLISLYAEAYQLTKNSLFKNVVYQTFDFVQRELTSSEGSFYSALDADSEGVEGKFYVWNKEEIELHLGDEAKLFSEYYNLNSTGLWEHGNYILLRKKEDGVIAEIFGITVDELRNRIQASTKILLEVRSKRIRPGLDDKQLTSWNALMLKACADAYRIFDDQKFLDAASTNVAFILNKVMYNSHHLKHSYKNGVATINGFLEDYAFVIEAFIAMYQSTFDESFLTEAKLFLQVCLNDFYDEQSGMFYFKSKTDNALFSKFYETQDNVIPASNSSIAKSLFYLSKFYGNEYYHELASKQLIQFKEEIKKYCSGYSNWATLMMHYVFPFYDVVISGKDCNEKQKELNHHFIPNKIIAGSKSFSELPILEERNVLDRTLIYICVNNACQLPVENTDQALELIKATI